MAFSREEILGEFEAWDNRVADRYIDCELHRRLKERERRKRLEAEWILDSRLRRKRARALADKRAPAPLPREVSCVQCRESFMCLHGLLSHLGIKHAGAEPHPTQRPRPIKLKIVAVRASARSHRVAYWKRVGT